MLFSFRSKKDLYEVGREIDKIMYLHNFPLQIMFSTSEPNHFNFAEDQAEETNLGYKWDKKNNLIIPDVTISHERPGTGKKGITLSEKEFSPLAITKRVV